MPIIKGTEYGKRCSQCEHNEGVLFKSLVKCALNHEILIYDGCKKCGTPKRKEVWEGKMSSCDDWKPHHRVDFDF